MLMPKTSVNKNNFPAAWKNQVGFAWKVFAM